MKDLAHDPITQADLHNELAAIEGRIVSRVMMSVFGAFLASVSVSLLSIGALLALFKWVAE